MKNRIIATFLCLCLLIGILPAHALSANTGAIESMPIDTDIALSEDNTAFPTTFDATTITYSVEGGNLYFDTTTGTIVDCDTTVTNAEIPEAINDIKVNSIGDNAFRSCKSLSQVTIPQSIISIGENAFNYCKSLNKIVIPDSVTQIGRGAFMECTSLADAKLSNSITAIENQTFRYCTSLKSIIIPDGVADIKSEVFLGCMNLTQVNIPERVTTIGDSAFKYCSSLGNIVIPNSVTTIGNEAFSGCEKLTSIAIPNSITKISNGMFLDCNSLIDVTMPDSITSIDNNAFADCDNLAQIALPNSVNTIGANSFGYCRNLRNITIPDSVTSIGSSAFTNCDSLASVSLPNGVTSIGNSAFANCSSLTSVVVPERITAIPNSMFAGCTSLINVILPSSVTSIGDYAFSYCHNLANITLPNTVVTIGDNAFWCCCHGFSDISIPDSVTSIGDNAFGSCTSLTNITLPNSVSAIGDAAFTQCRNLNNVTLPNSITAIEERLFSHCDNLTNITLPGSITTIGAGAFANCVNLTNISIPNSVTTIESEAFYYCGLVSIEIPKSVVSIGEMAFNGLGCLTNIDVETGSTHYRSFGGVLFDQNMTTLCVFPDGKSGTYTIPSSVNAIGKNAFYACKDLTNVIIPDSVTTIGDGSFWSCRNLVNITLPSSITTIGNTAFYYCTSLSNITIPSSITSIGESAFVGCDSLTSIYFQGDAPSVSAAGANAPSFEKNTVLYYIEGKAGWTTPIWNGFNAAPYRITNGDGVAYPISYLSAYGGKISGNYTQALPGTTVQLEVIPESGKRLVYGSLTCNGKPLYSPSFVMPEEPVIIAAKFEDLLQSSAQPIIYGEKVDWKYKNSFLWIDDKTIPPFPSGSDKDYQQEFEYWASQFGYDLSGISIEELLKTPVRIPYSTEHHELLFDAYSQKTVKDVMADILMFGKMQEYLWDTEQEVKNSRNTVEQLNTSTKDMLKYMDRYKEYVGKLKDFKYDPMTGIQAAIALEPMCEDILTSDILGEKLGLLDKFKSFTIELTPEAQSIVNSIKNESNSVEYSNYFQALEDIITTGGDLYQQKYGAAVLPVIDTLIENNFSRNQTWKDYKKYAKPLGSVYTFVKSVNGTSSVSPILALGQIYVKYIEFAMDMYNYIADQYPSWLFWMNYYVAAKYPAQYRELGFESTGRFPMDSIYNTIDATGTDNLTRLLLSIFDGSNQNGALRLYGAQDSYGMDQGKREILINNAIMLSQISQCDFRYAQECLVKYAIAAQSGTVNAIQAKISCPVDIELLNADGDVVFSLKNGSEYTQNYNQYCSFYLTGENRDEKTIIYPENYTLSIIPYASGTMECSVIEDSATDTVLEKSYSSLALTPGVTYTLEKQQGSQDTKLTVKDQEVLPNNTQEFATRLSIGAHQTEMQMGSSQQLSILLNDIESSTSLVKWSSSNPSCISVNENGLLLAHSSGTAVITATYESPTTVDVGISITVLPKTPAQFELSLALAGCGNISFHQVQKYTAGEDVELIAVPGKNNTFVEWATSDGDVYTGEAFHFNMPDHDIRITAYFKPEPLSSTPASCTTSSIALTPYQDDSNGVFGEIQYGYGSNPSVISNWQTSPIFENLQPDTAYTFFVRYAGTNDILPSKVSDGTVIRTAASSHALNVFAPTFDSVAYGYGQPEAKSIVMTNTGTSEAVISNVTLSGSAAKYFLLNKTTGITLPAGTTDNTSYTIQPITNLDVGSYTATITVTYDSTYIATAEVFFTVEEGTSNPGSSSQPGQLGHAIAVEKVENGTIDISSRSAKAGDVITITATPSKGYKLNKLIITDSKGTELRYCNEGKYKYTFTMPNSNVTVSAVFMESIKLPFADVADDAYYTDAVTWAVVNNITNGTSDTTFSPHITCTRAQIVTFLWRANGAPESAVTNPFTDVAEDAYYYDAVMWAIGQGITTGTTASTFSPDMTCTRAQMATFLWRASGFPTTSSKTTFTDIPENTWYATAVTWAAENGITYGTGNERFSPGAHCTRAQIVTFLFRAQGAGLMF